MKILYASKYGATKKGAELLKAKLGEAATLCDLSIDEVDLQNEDTVVIGSGIYAGRLHGAVKRFCEHNKESLLNKKLGLYVCCRATGDEGWKQFDNAYPKELREHATAKGLFGYELRFDEMSFLVRKFLQLITKTKQNESKIYMENIVKFVEELKNTLG